MWTSGLWSYSLCHVNWAQWWHAGTWLWWNNHCEFQSDALTLYYHLAQWHILPIPISQSLFRYSLCLSMPRCQKVLLHSINGHLRSSLFYDYLLVSDVLDINDLLDTRSLGMYSACMAPHFPALLCSVYRHCSFPRCYTSHCVCPSLNCVFPTALCCAQITSVVSNRW